MTFENWPAPNNAAPQAQDVSPPCEEVPDCECEVNEIMTIGQETAQHYDDLKAQCVPDELATRLTADFHRHLLIEDAREREHVRVMEAVAADDE